MKVLVTGATGFIGRHLRQALSNWCEVVALARGPADPLPGETWVQADLASPLHADLPAVDAIVHLAQANVPWPEGANTLLAVNTAAAVALLEHGRRTGARRFVYASSGDVYGPGAGAPWSEDAPAHPASFYGVTKYAAELALATYGEHLTPCVLRLFTPFGPGQEGRLIPRLIARVRDRQPIRVAQGMGPRLSPTYIADVVAAFEAALRSSRAGTFNVAGPEVMSLRDISGEIGRLLGREPLYESTDEPAATVAGRSERAGRELGVVPRTTLREGLACTLGLAPAGVSH